MKTLQELKTLIKVGIRQEVCPQDIVLLEASLNYTHLYFSDGKKLLVSYNLGKVHQKLIDFNFFVRPNRNMIVNMRFLRDYSANTLNINHRIINISRRRKETVFDFLENLKNPVNK